MPCNSCGVSTYNFNNNYYKNQPVGDCGFTQPMLIEWRDKLICARDANKLAELGITKAQLNSMLGMVLSGLNLNLNICFLEDRLAQIEPTINQITTLGIC